MSTVVSGDFEWHDAKAESNARKHGITFEEAALALLDPNSVDFDDALHPDRVVSLARHPVTGVLYVVWTEGAAERTRILSARKALSHERRSYEEGR